MKRSTKTSLLLLSLVGILSACSFHKGSSSSNPNNDLSTSSSSNFSSESSSSSSSSSQESSSLHVHTAGTPIEENKVEATCTIDGSYDLVTYCSSCREEMSREHKIITAKGHTLVSHPAKAATCTEIGWNAYETCSKCSYTTYVEIPATGHIHTATREENRVEPTCEQNGSYDLVTYCTDDNVVLSRETKVINATGHDLIHHDAKEATCTEIGWNAYVTCSKCSYSTYVEIPATGHIHTATREENRVEPTCTEEGSYDVITYCLIDGETVTTEHITIPAKGHAFIHYPGKDPTDTTVGWYPYDKCMRCGYSTYTEIPPVGHENLATREENRVEPTCTKDGYYDLVTYCLDDGFVVSTTRVVLPALGHDLVHYDAKEPTETEVGWYEYEACTRCSYSTYVEIPATGAQSNTISAERTYVNYISNNYYSLSCTPSTGTAKLLVVPIWFADSDTYITLANREKVRSDIQKAYFGTNEETGWRSVKTYYEEESHGALTLEGTVSEWYVLTDNSSLYGPESGGSSKTSSLVSRAADWYFNNHQNESRKDYDRDGDGYLDGVMLIYARPNYISSHNYAYKNFWAYTYWVQNTSYKNKNNPGPNAFFWASYDFMYGSNRAYAATGASSCAYGDTRYCNVDSHTFIHEMGHMFGLSDYYDYSDFGYKPAGGFSMQDQNVGGHDPFSSFALGWGKAYIPTSSKTITVKPFATTGEMIILSPSWNNYNSAFDEYLILEYYTPTALNEFDTTHTYNNGIGGSSTSGIRLWHVDGRLLYTMYGGWSINNVTTNPLIRNYKVTSMMTNSYDDGSSSSYGRISPLGSDYANYNQLQLIRNSTTATYTPSNRFKKEDLFRTGNSFAFSTYQKQFVDNGTLNSGKALGFRFEVGEITNEGATITITKE